MPQELNQVIRLQGQQFAKPFVIPFTWLWAGQTGLAEYKAFLSCTTEQMNYTGENMTHMLLILFQKTSAYLQYTAAVMMLLYHGFSFKILQHVKLKSKYRYQSGHLPPPLMCLELLPPGKPSNKIKNTNLRFHSFKPNRLYTCTG